MTLGGIASALGRGVYHAIGAVQAVVEFVSTGRRLVRDARRGKLALEPVSETDPFPLERRAGRRDEIRPPRC